MEFVIFLVITTIGVVAFLYWYMTKGSGVNLKVTPSIYRTPGVTPGYTQGITPGYTQGITPGVTPGATIGPQYAIKPIAAQRVSDQTIRNLNRMYGNGKLPTTSSYAGVVASGKVAWDPNRNSWTATSGKYAGYSGVGNASSQDIRNLNRLYGSGNVSTGSRLYNLYASGKAQYVGGQWVPTSGSSGPSAAGSDVKQVVRNLNRMYGNGKLPTTSDYAGIVASGQVAWNPAANAWMPTSGKYAGYSAVGNAGTMDLSNINRLYPNGQIPVGSRFYDLYAAGKVQYNGGRWVGA